MTARRAGEWPLTPMQLGMVSQTLHGESQRSYLQQRVCICSKKLELPLIADAFTVLARRHQALRLRFHWNEAGEPWQTVSDSPAVPCTEAPWEGEESFRQFLTADRARRNRASRRPAASRHRIPERRERNYRSGHLPPRHSGWAVESNRLKRTLRSLRVREPARGLAATGAAPFHGISHMARES